MSVIGTKRTFVTKLDSEYPGSVEDTLSVRQSSYSIEMSFPV